MMFAGATVTLLAGIGAAVDFSNMSSARTALQAQVDAGVLAAAVVDIKAGQSGNEKALRMNAATQAIEANGFQGPETSTQLTIGESSIILRAETEYRPFFGRFLGVNRVRLSADSESGLPGRVNVDIALVLDSTDSMRDDGKIDALKDGATRLVQAIEDSGSESKISLVPFSRYVRLNDNVRSESWFQLPLESERTRIEEDVTRTGGTCQTVTRTRVRDGVRIEVQREECENQIETSVEVEEQIISRWDGCVGTRRPPLSEIDGDYNHKIPGLLRIVPKEETGLRRDFTNRCPSEIVPLTADYRKLKDEIDDLSLTDDTYLPSGLIWGQRVLSPGVPFSNPPVAGEGDKRQILVLMTDGKNTTEIREDAASVADYEAPPHIASVDGTADGAVATEANEATARLCNSVKSDGIEIYTIAFQVSDPLTVSLLKNCATSPETALTADSNAELVAEFESIAKSIRADIRLIR